MMRNLLLVVCVCAFVGCTSPNAPSLPADTVRKRIESLDTWPVPVYAISHSLPTFKLSDEHVLWLDGNPETGVYIYKNTVYGVKQ